MRTQQDDDPKTADEKTTPHSSKETTTTKAKIADEEAKKLLEKKEVIKTRRPDTIKYIEKKLADKGLHRMDRHPVDGMSLNRVPKSGHGGKYTWEGPDGAEAELDPVPPAIDLNDPNYVEDEDEEEVKEEVKEVVVGEVEVAKVAEAKEGVSRIEIQS